MKGFPFIHTRHKTFGIFNIFPLSATPLCLVRNIFWEKDDFCHNYFKLVHAPTLKIPLYMVRDVFIHTNRETFGIFALSATPLCVVRYIVLEKDDFFMKNFKLVHAPS